MQTKIRCRQWTVVLLLTITLFGVGDLVYDVHTGAPMFHLVIEIILLLTCLATAFYLGAGWYGAQRKLSNASYKQQRAQVFMEGLASAIEAQLGAWGLSDAERSTALLVLKGLSHKDIANVTGRSERTVRQHAVSIYRKSGLSNRAELSAFFLEDLLLPLEGTERPHPVASEPETGEAARRGDTAAPGQIG